MGLETLNSDSLPDALNEDWPSGTDPKSEGDDHLRNIKLALKNFYNKVKLGTSDLPEGALPVVLGGALVDSGLRYSGSFLRFLGGVRAANYQHRMPGEARINMFPMTAINEENDARTFEISVQSPGPVVLNANDGSLNSGPIDYAYNANQDLVIQQIDLKSAVALAAVRITLYNEFDEVEYQSATDAALKNGLGFSLQAGGTTQVLLTNWLPVAANANLRVKFDRYDADTDSITTSGFQFYGSTIGGEFVPYMVVVARIFTYNTLARLSDIKFDKTYTDRHAPISVNLTTFVQISQVNVTFPAAGKYLIKAFYHMENPSQGEYAFSIQANGNTVDGSIETTNTTGNSSQMKVVVSDYDVVTPGAVSLTLLARCISNGDSFNNTKVYWEIQKTDD